MWKKLSNCQVVKFDPRDICQMSNACVDPEQLLFSCVCSKLTLTHSHSLTLSHSHTLSISQSITLDMLNNFCFHLYAQKSLFIGENVNAFLGTSMLFF